MAVTAASPVPVEPDRQGEEGNAVDGRVDGTPPATPLAGADHQPDEATGGFDDVADTPEAKLVAALVRAQAAFPAVDKRHTATVRPRDKPAYTYSYADLADILGAVRPVLARHGLAITQQTSHAQPDGRVLLTTTLRHVAGASLASEVELGQSPGNPQQFGGALTYLRRYELVTLLGIAAEEDRDAQDVEPAVGGGGAPAEVVELPGWTQHVTRADAKAAFMVALTKVCDGDRELAKEFATSWARACGGGIPGVLFGAITALRPATPEELAESAAAAKDAQAQAAAGEQPDRPAPEPEPDHDPNSVDDSERAAARAQQPDPPEDPPAPAATATTPAAAGRAEISPPAGFANWPTAEAFVERLAAESTGPVGLKAAETALKAAGCVCSDPLGIRGHRHVDDACPFPDHGIPF
jgi:hypothetical protein